MVHRSTLQNQTRSQIIADEEHPTGRKIWDADETLPTNLRRARSADGCEVINNVGLSKSCHTGGGLSRIKNALTRSVHGTHTAPKPNNSPCHVEYSITENPSVVASPSDIANFAEKQNFNHMKKPAATQHDCRAHQGIRKNSFRRKKSFEELDEETDESSDEHNLRFRSTPEKCASLRVTAVTPKPDVSKMHASMNEINTSGRFRSGLLLPRNSFRNSGKGITVKHFAEVPIPVHMAAERAACQKVNIDRTMRASTSAIPTRPPRAVVEKKQQRHSNPPSSFPQSNLVELQKAFDKEDNLDHYFEIVKASPQKSPSRGARSVQTYSPSSGLNKKMNLPIDLDVRSVFSPTKSQCSTGSRSPKRSPPSSHSVKSPKLLPISDSGRPSLIIGMAKLHSDKAPLSPQEQVRAAQLDIPLAKPKDPLPQLDVQFSVYDKLNHSSRNILNASFRTQNSDTVAWDLDQIMMGKV